MMRQTLINEFYPENAKTVLASQGSEKVVKGSEKILTTFHVSVSPGKRNNNNTRSIRTIMSGHHIRFFARYKGKQPYDSECSIKPVGKGNWDKHIWERQSYKIIAGTKTLEVTLEHDGSLDSVKEKLDYCQETAERIGRVFAERHGLELLTPFELSNHSHWVIEHKKTGDLLRPLIQKPKNERVGAIDGDSSHPDKIELIGPDSAKGAEGMDGLLIDLPAMLGTWNQGQIRYMQEMKILLGAIGQSISLQTELLKKLSK